MTDHEFDLRGRINREVGTPYTFVIRAAHDQPMSLIEEKIAAWLGLGSAEALKALGVSVSRMPDAVTDGSSVSLQDYYVAVVLPLVEPVTPEQLFEIARQMRDAGPFEQVDADVPVTYFIPDRDAVPEVGTVDRQYQRSALALFGGNCSPESSGQWPWPTDWSLSAMNVQKAWEMGAKGRGITIGLIDTGWAAHTHINASVFDVAHSRDLVDGDNDATDPLDAASKGILRFPGHGTATASVAAALKKPDEAPVSALRSSVTRLFRCCFRKEKQKANALPPLPLSGQISGVAPEAKLLPIRFTVTVAAVTGVRLCEALDCIVELKKANPDAVHIISISQGCLPFPWVRDAIRRAVEHNLIVVASAGNWPKPVIWPAAFPECIAVAGIGPDKQPWPCTGRGAAISFCTPSGQVWRATFRPDPQLSTKLVPSFEPGSGTSFAAPQAAGVAALWLSHFTPSVLRGICEEKGIVLQELFRSLVQQTAFIPPNFDRQTWMEEYGAGIVDAEALLNADPRQVPAARVLREMRAPTTTPALVSQMVEDYATETTRSVLREVLPPAAFGGDEGWRAETVSNTLETYAELLEVDEQRVGDVLEANRAEVFHILLEHPAIFDQLVREIIQRSTGAPGPIPGAIGVDRLSWLKQAHRDVASSALIEG